MIWREKKKLLIPIAILLLINIFFFLTYRVRYAERVRELHGRLDTAKASLQHARAEHKARQAELSGYKDVLKSIDTIYSTWWSTPERRLTRLIVEVRALTARSDLKEPPSTTYEPSVSQKKDFATSVVGVSFAVVGSYSNVRKLINLLELSKQFLIVDRISLNNSGEVGSQTPLQLDIHLKTIFSDRRADAAGNRAAGGSQM
ncbi:MAG TPA: GspMb/PilO family protein [Thermoanaerobaculia bacterium]|nr:GspMb/PilO family protein [Thermoanaerobaculia bacterium]